MRVLTFNSHQPYVHLLASSLPWTVGVITPRLGTGSLKEWDDRIRPLPENIHLYSSAGNALRDSPWDWILTHNIHDLIDVKDVALPKAFLIHGTLSGRIIQDRSDVDRALYLKNLQLLLTAHGARVLYISELKRRDWGIPGAVILPAVDVHLYGGYAGETRGALQVCNHLKTRGAMMGWETYRAVCHDQPNLVLGENEGLPSSRRTKSWDDLKQHLRAFRVYLYTPVYPYEDGYNLALLEAMATGMPIATLKNASSPVRDGVEGVVGSNVAELREKVLYLLDNRDAAVAMGKAARARVEQLFPLSNFVDAWQSFARRLLNQ